MLYQQSTLVIEQQINCVKWWLNGQINGEYDVKNTLSMLLS